MIYRRSTFQVAHIFGIAGWKCAPPEKTIRLRLFAQLPPCLVHCSFHSVQNANFYR